MSALAAEDWRRIFALLDTALELPAHQRDGWLAGLEAGTEPMLPVVRELLASRARIETAGFMSAPARIATQASTTGERPAYTAETGPGDFIGPYRLLRELGVGGMGAVWLAERADGVFKREIALKLPHAGPHARTFAERFARERDILAALDHPHIARLYDSGVTSDGRFFLALEYVEGERIDSYCDRRKLALPERIRLFLEVLRAVQYAHGQLVVHRDLKPANILVTVDGAAKLLDFGIAKLLTDGVAQETALTQFAGRALTPEYAAPEQILGRPLGVASDIYSLAVVLYELLAGARPYRLQRESRGALEDAVLAVDPPPPSEAASDAAAAARATTAARLRRALRGDLDTIVLKALKKSPADRYDSAAAFADDLERHLRSEPVRARPDSFAYRLQKFMLRHRLESAAALAVVIALIGGAHAQVAVATALVAGTGVAAWQARKARAQAQRAQLQAERAERVKAFVLSIFECADAETGGGASMTAVEVLRRARERIGEEIANDPEITVELLTSVGRSLIGLNQDALALPVLDEALQLATTCLPPEHVRTLEAQLECSAAFQLNGRIVEARRMLEPTVESLRRRQHDDQLVMALRLMAMVCRSEGRAEESVRCAREALQVAERQPDSPRQRKLLMYGNLSLAYALRYAGRPGMLEPARRSYEVAQRIYRDPNATPVFDTHEAYATALVEEGDAAMGLRELTEVVVAKAKRLGPRHRAAAMGHSQLGHAQLRLGYVDDAIRSYSIAKDMSDAIDGDACVPDRGFTRLNLGQALLRARRYGEAASTLGEAERILSTAFEPMHERACVARAAQAAALARCAAADVADELVRRLPDAQRFSVPSRRLIESCIATVDLARGRHDKAVERLRGVVDSFDSGARPVVPLAIALAELGSALMAIGKAGEAVAAFETACDLFSKLQLNLSPDRAEAQAELVRLRQASQGT